jgi:PAS domain S-box-containing protein
VGIADVRLNKDFGWELLIAPGLPTSQEESSVAQPAGSATGRVVHMQVQSEAETHAEPLAEEMLGGAAGAFGPRSRRTRVAHTHAAMASISVRRVMLVLALPVLLIALGLYATAHLERNAALVGASRQRGSERLLAAMLNQETGARGFFQTRTVVFLQPWTLGTKAFASGLPEERTLVAGNADLERMLDRQAQLAARWQAVTRTAITAVERSGRLPSIAESLRQKALMDRFRALHASFGAALARQRRASLEFATTATTAIALLLVVMLLGIALLTRRVVRSEDARRLRDIGERERALRDGRARLQSTFDHVPAVLALRDLEGRYEHVNAEFVRAFGGGVTIDEILGRHFDELFTENDAITAEIREGANAEYQAVLASGVIVHTELTVQVAGSDRDFLRVRYPVMDADDHITGIGLFMLDITERRRSERDLRDRTEALTVVNSELEAFSYTVSHDLRAPLRSLAGFSDALMEDHAEVLDEDGLDYLKRINAAAQRMSNLLDGLLALSRLARSEFKRARVDISAIVHEITDDLQLSEPGRRVRFKITEGLTASGDASLIRVAFENLLQNAWKFTSEQPTAVIEVGTTELDGGRAFFVSDDGAGFDMTYAATLFGVFKRLHGEHEFPGTGIGLATVARVVARHGGKIAAEGHVGDGATFTFTL